MRQSLLLDRRACHEFVQVGDLTLVFHCRYFGIFTDIVLKAFYKSFSNQLLAFVLETCKNARLLTESTSQTKSLALRSLRVASRASVQQSPS